MAGKSKWIPKDLKKGAFTSQAKRAGMSVSSYAKKVLSEGSKASPTTKRRARLAQTFKKMANARKKK